MRNKFRTKTVVTACVVGALGALMVPGPAGANHTTTRCTGTLGSSPVTIGVGGQDVATTPQVSVSVCVTAPYTGMGTPTPRVESTYYTGVFVDFPTNGPTGVTATYTYSYEGSGTTQTVTVPIPGASSGTMCLFFMGSSYDNPGGCLAYLES